MFKLIQKNNPKQYYETQKEDFLVGKSNQCEIVIVDPHISDVQAKVGTKNNTYFIKNLGQNPIQEFQVLHSYLASIEKTIRSQDLSSQEFDHDSRSLLSPEETPDTSEQLLPLLDRVLLLLQIHQDQRDEKKRNDCRQYRR